MISDMRKKTVQKNRKPTVAGEPVKASEFSDPLLDDSSDDHSQLITDGKFEGDEGAGADIEHSSFTRLLLLAKPESGTSVLD